MIVCISVALGHKHEYKYLHKFLLCRVFSSNKIGSSGRILFAANWRWLLSKVLRNMTNDTTN